jgi:hypothetical protein
LKKVRQRTFLYDTKSPGYRDHHMRANAWEGIGKELKIKRKFYVNSRDVRIVCPGFSVCCQLLNVNWTANVPTNITRELSLRETNKET